MSIMLAAAGCMAASPNHVLSITYGEESGTGFRGFSDGVATSSSFGGLSPATLNGETVRATVTSPSSSDLIFAIDGNHPQDFFLRFFCERGLFSSADANYSYNSTDDYTRWIWENTGLFPSSGSGTVSIYD